MRAPAALLAALAALALAAAQDTIEQYEVEVYKGAEGSALGVTLGPFYIPDGQCSGVLDQVLRCAARGGPAAAAVRVRDAARFPLVALRDSLRRASVVRAPPCRGEAAVHVRLACDT